jgi:hypothetical protein
MFGPLLGVLDFLVVGPLLGVLGGWWGGMASLVVGLTVGTRPWFGCCVLEDD